MVFYLSQSQISSVVQDSPGYFSCSNNSLVWIVSICPPISNSSNPISKFANHNCYHRDSYVPSLSQFSGKVRVLSSSFAFFVFTLWSAETEKSTRQVLLIIIFTLFIYLFILLYLLIAFLIIIGFCLLALIRVSVCISEFQRILCVSFCCYYYYNLIFIFIFTFL